MHVDKNKIGKIVIIKAWTSNIMYIMYSIVYNSIRGL